MPTAEPGGSPAGRVGRPGLLAVAGACWAAFIVYQSLAGGTLGACGAPLRQQGPSLSFSDGLANLLAYLPLGLLLGAWLAPTRSRRVWCLAMLAPAGLSLLMELIQACMAARVSSWFDLAMNAAGGLIGVLVMGRAGRRRLAAPSWLDPLVPDATRALLWPVLLVTGSWLALSLAPWRFTLDVSTVRANLAFLLGWADWHPDPWRLARHLAGWLAFAVALRALWRRRASASLARAAAMALARGGRLMLTRQALSFDELWALALAGGLALALPSFSSTAVLARALPVLAVAAVAAYQLAPGTGPVTAWQFHWLPQIGLGNLLSAVELSLMYGWLAFTLVLALRWRAHHGEPPGRARYLLPATVVALMLATELVQGWIPGRVPDSSAPLLTGLGFAVGWALLGAPVPPAGAGVTPGAGAPHGRLRGRAAARVRRPAV